jgi:shikimate kinase|tara:strand:+ start:277 stop:786 length:510 start_codon:yes stop_codon:yes gene_type:complete
VKKNLVLLGMMAVGKTTLGKIVAKIQGLEFIDIDTNIEKRNSMSINEIFNKKGEKFFRTEEEKEVLNSLKKKNCVIALGGGAFVNKIIRVNVLKDAISVWLDVDIDILNKRVKWSQKRPLLQEKNNKKILEKLYEKRKEFYKQANYKIACNKLNKQDVIKKIITLYAKQ